MKFSKKLAEALALVALFLAVLALVGGDCKGQSIMDDTEDVIAEEYRLHDIESLTQYVLTLEAEPGTFKGVKVNGKVYKKMRVKVYGGGAESNDGTIEVRFYRLGREYVFFRENNKVRLISDNLSFEIQYLVEKKEMVMLNVNSGSELKVYGYVYALNDGYKKGEKLQDWVVRDAIGRANSINYKNKL